MRSVTVRPPAVTTAVATAFLAAIMLAGCGTQGGPTPITSAGASTATISPASPQPVPTPVPGGQSETPEPVPTRVSTTQTEWGEILDAVPSGFPVFPGAKVADGVAEPVSLALSAPATGDVVAAWYRDALAAQGYSVQLSDALEDGSRVLDAASDLPECMIRMDFRPAPESTMISVLYAAGCAGVGG